MNRLLVPILAAMAVTADAATSVGILPLGPQATDSLHWTTSSSNKISPAGLKALWSHLHTPQSPKLLPPNLPVVADLFVKPHVGLVLNVVPDAEGMSALPLPESAFSLKVSGDVQPMELIQRAKVEELDAPFEGKGDAKAPFEFAAASVPQQQVGQLLADLQAWADRTETRMLVHVLVESKTSTSTSVASSRRRLNEEEGEGEENREGDEGEENREEEGEGEQNKENQQGGYQGGYGYGYYNAYDEWVTPYKTMFQIQYFNVVLWTSIGLAVVLIFTIGLMINMPLMADTLLFGESAKLPVED